MPGDRARNALAGTRFADVRWVAETASTNADALVLARAGVPEGVVLVADHQTAGRGRQGRSWAAPPGASLLVTVLLRPPPSAASLCTMALGLAAADAVEAVAGFAPRLKWPNDLVWPGDGTAADRKIAGILAEADWSESVAVAAGIGLNVNWPAELPSELADIAVACNHVAGHAIDREDLLIAMLRALDTTYRLLVEGRRHELLDDWRRRSATLGRQVRVETTAAVTEGVARDIDDSGHLVVDTGTGEMTFAVGDVVHVRPVS